MRRPFCLFAFFYCLILFVLAVPERGVEEDAPPGIVSGTVTGKDRKAGEEMQLHLTVRQSDGWNVLCVFRGEEAVIDETTGQILEGPKALTCGCGGRDAEGPHIFRKGAYYYLLLAEGGTKDGHMVTMMRARNIWGPYEASPFLPVISASDRKV